MDANVMPPRDGEPGEALQYSAHAVFLREGGNRQRGIPQAARPPFQRCCRLPAESTGSPPLCPVPPPAMPVRRAWYAQV